MKNLSMGCVDQGHPGALHGLEGGLEWDREKVHTVPDLRGELPQQGHLLPRDRFKVFYHNCKLCQHCVSICRRRRSA